MPVPTLITDLSTTIASNSPPGSESPASLDDYQRAHAAFIAQLHANTVEAATIIVASATSTAIGAAASNNVDISGTTTITSFDTVAEGINRKGRFTGILTLTHNATSLILPGNANITTAANDRYEARSLGAGNWIVTKYVYASGNAISATLATTATNQSGGTVAATRLSLSTGSLASVTQATSKSTSVTLNNESGNIVMNAAALAADTSVSFTLFCNKVNSNDLVIITYSSPKYTVIAEPSSINPTTEIIVTVRNVTPASLSELVILYFALLHRT